jgi:hypothetical protein
VKLFDEGEIDYAQLGKHREESARLFTAWVPELLMGRSNTAFSPAHPGVVHAFSRAGPSWRPRRYIPSFV